ncbi:MAG: V-type ATP synthase subunit K [Hyperthermus sp.]|nr:MAG: V-type ATP synthase subunit K [Hyperthermus sp.]
MIAARLSWIGLIAALFLLALPAHAAGGDESAATATAGKAIAAALAIGLSAIGAGYAVGNAGAAASAATAEKPEIMGRLLIYLVLGEGIAIYGLLISILVIFAIK